MADVLGHEEMMEEGTDTPQILKTLGGTVVGAFAGFIVCALLDIVIWGVIFAFKFVSTHSMDGPGFPIETFTSQVRGSLVIAGAAGILTGALTGAYQSFARN